MSDYLTEEPTFSRGDLVTVDGQKSVWAGTWRVTRVNKTTARLVHTTTGAEERAPLFTLAPVEPVGPCGCPACDKWADCDYCGDCR